MIIITGANGFIGSTLTSKLIELGYGNLLLVDNYLEKRFEFDRINKVDRSMFFSWFFTKKPKIDFIFHLGAKTDTLCMDQRLINNLNISFTKRLLMCATQYDIPIIFASSAATYGNGEYGYDDNHDLIDKLKPLNLYGESKHHIDKWILNQERTPPFWASLKFFNVYGKNEQHKGNMSSMIYKTFNQINKNKIIDLFKYGEQKRDFICVDDVIDVCLFFMKKQKESGIYNVGTGEARSFNDVANIIFEKSKIEKNINYIDMPDEIKKHYQEHTEANIDKLRKMGYNKEFHTLENGIKKCYYE